LDRAEVHLGEFKTLISPLLQRCKNPVSKGWETKNNKPALVYRVRFSNPPADERLAVIAGDVMLNVRSALDHIAVVLAPNNRKFKASFPIFTCNVHEREEITGDYLHAGDHKAWVKCVKGMPDDAVTWLDSIQPYRAVYEGQDPEDHALALLGSFQNADKHRQLAIVAQGLEEPDFFFTHADGTVQHLPFDPDIFPKDRLLRDGAIVHYDFSLSPGQMELEIEGTPRVVIGSAVSGPVRRCPDALDKMITEARRVIAPLVASVA
jgi:hypothetical protein